MHHLSNVYICIINSETNKAIIRSDNRSKEGLKNNEKKNFSVLFMDEGLTDTPQINFHSSEELPGRLCLFSFHSISNKRHLTGV